MQGEKKSVYKRGADDGFIFGAYLAVWFIMLCCSLYVNFLAIPSLIMMAGVPFIIYAFLRRSYVRDFGLSSFSELWLQGIITFVCGTLIMACVGFVFMRFVRPDYIHDLWSAAIELYESVPDSSASDFARTLRLMEERNMLPQPIYVVVEMMLSGVFTGSILSMILTWIVRLRKVRTRLDDVTSSNS